MWHPLQGNGCTFQIMTGAHVNDPLRNIMQNHVTSRRGENTIAFKGKASPPTKGERVRGQAPTRFQNPSTVRGPTPKPVQRGGVQTKSNGKPLPQKRHRAQHATGGRGQSLASSTRRSIRRNLTSFTPSMEESVPPLDTGPHLPKGGRSAEGSAQGNKASREIPAPWNFQTLPKP